MVESYDVLVALMETEVLDEALTCVRTSNRKSAESVARHLLSRLERREGQGRDSGLATSGLDTTWDDSSGSYSHTTSSTSTTSSGLEQDFTKVDENQAEGAHLQAQGVESPGAGHGDGAGVSARLDAEGGGGGEEQQVR